MTRKLVRFCLVLVCLLAVTAGSAGAPRTAAMKAQPALLAMVATRPEAQLSVIVQMMPADTSAETVLAQLGGTLTQDLRLINAFAATVPSGAVSTLAGADGVRWVSLDAPVSATTCDQCVNTANLQNVYVQAIHADQVWNGAPYLQGQGVGVAVMDSGVNPNSDLYTSAGVNRQVAAVHFNTDYNQTSFDGYGHGTHVAIIVAGNGSQSNGRYIGVAPMANVVNVKVSNDDGSAQIQSVVGGLQWVLAHKAQYNIRIVNLSLNSAVAESYQTSPLDAAVEVLWFNGIVVVVSAGNAGAGALYPPGNDPFVITVGAVDDKGSANPADDSVANFSAYGTTSDGFAKPDLVAPGKNIIAKMINMNMGLAAAHPANIVPGQYFRMSGTSMAAPMVSGAAALLLQSEPALSPDQVKYRLKATANQNWPGYSALKAGAGYLDIFAAVRETSKLSANTGLRASKLLWSGSQPATWGSVNWNSVNWNSVNWNSVNWNSVNWNSVNLNSDYWGQ